MCKKCGRSHTRGNCPAFGKHCSKCGGVNVNHFSVGCQANDTNKLNSKLNKNKRLNEIQSDQLEEPACNELYLDTLNIINSEKNLKCWKQSFFLLKPNEVQTIQLDWSTSQMW